MTRGMIVTAIMQLIVCTSALAAPRVDKPAGGKLMKNPAQTHLTKTKASGTPTTNINMPLKKKKEHLTGEKVYRSKQSAVQFDATVIEGEAVRPVVSSVSSKKSDSEFDLIPIRKKWHSEMISSTIEY